MGHQLIYQHMYGVPGEYEQGKGARSTFEKITASSFPNLIKDMNLHFQRSTNSNGVKAKRSILRHIIMKSSKAKEKQKIMKAMKTTHL